MLEEVEYFDFNKVDETKDYDQVKESRTYSRNYRQRQKMNNEHRNLALSLLVAAIVRKIPNFIFFSNPAKQIELYESTAKEISFEWSHYRI